MATLDPKRQRRIIRDVLHIAANALPLGQQLEERMRVRDKNYSDAEIFVAEMFMQDLASKLREQAREKDIRE